MSQIDLDSKELETKVKNEFNKLCSEGIYRRGILATSKDNHVTARRMRLIPDGLTLYAYTDSRSLKIDQIKSNPYVAVVAGFIQIEAIAELCGHPLKPENNAYIEAYVRKLPEWYEKHEKPAFESVDHLELIKIIPIKVSLPSAVDSLTKEILDVEKGTAYKISGVDWTQASAYKT